MKFLSEKVKNFIRKFFLINDDPHKIAAGAALGVFLGIVPGEGLATTLILASLLRLNRLAATSGVLASNMWSTAVALPFAATTGGFLFGEKEQSLLENFRAAYHLGIKYFLSKAILLDVALPLVAGFVIVAGSVALLCYLLIYLLLKKHKLEFRKKDQ